MKLPIVLLLAGAAGVTVSVRAFEASHSSEATSKHTTYYANGQVETECELRADHREGLCRRFYPDGSPMAEGRYAEGRMQGEWTFWLRDGSVDAERSGVYASGVKTGT